MLLAILAVACTSPEPEAPRAPSPDAAVRDLHREAIVVDGHNDVTSFILDYRYDLGMDGADPAKRAAARYWVPFIRRMLPEPSGDALRTSTDLRRMREGGLDAQFFSIYADPRRFGDAPRERALAMIAALEEQVARHSDQLELARSAADVRRIVADGRIAALMGLEGGHAIENDLAHLRDFYARGIRYMTLTWSNTNDWADSSTDRAHHGGLSPFGREVVREMNRLGMLVDVSHGSDETFWDALEVSEAPLIASHSSARALVDHPRNMSDAMLRGVARNGGVVMINFSENYIDRRKAGVWASIGFGLRHLGWEDSPFDRLVEHFVHAIQVAGVDHVGLGSDFDGTLFLPSGMKDVADLPNLTAALLQRGYSRQDVRKVLGENVLRVLEDAEATSVRLAR
jgi:membrane dipeptidase